MRKVLILLLLCCWPAFGQENIKGTNHRKIFTSGGGGSFAHIQGAPSTDANIFATTTIPSGASASPTSTGNLLVVWIAFTASGGQTVASVADTGGSSFSLAVAVNGAGANAGFRQEIWYTCSAVGASSNVVTATFSASLLGDFALVSYEEYSGNATSSCLDKAVGQAGTSSSGSDNCTSTAQTTTTNGQLIYGAGFFASSGTPGSAFTGRSSQSGGVTEDRVQTSAGSVAAIFNDSTVGEDYGAAMATFKHS